MNYMITLFVKIFYFIGDQENVDKFSRRLVN